jgi:hypothetical protein
VNSEGFKVAWVDSMGRGADVVDYQDGWGGVGGEFGPEAPVDHGGRQLSAHASAVVK